LLLGLLHLGLISEFGLAKVGDEVALRETFPHFSAAIVVAMAVTSTSQ
jgi:hypothetical protein